MGSLLHPVGAQPARVYWARRAVLIGALVLLIVIGFALFRPPGTGNVAAVPAPSVTPAQTPTTSTPPATETPTPTPTGPVVCDQTNSELALAGYQKVKQDGKQAFRVAVTNTGKQPCVLDLKATNFSLLVTSGTDRIWTTDHCAKWVPAKKQTLKSQKSYEFTLQWGVNRSMPDCKQSKTQLRPGTYVASATFVENLKGRQVFQVTKAG